MTLSRSTYSHNCLGANIARLVVGGPGVCRYVQRSRLPEHLLDSLTFFSIWPTGLNSQARVALSWALPIFQGANPCIPAAGRPPEVFYSDDISFIIRTRFFDSFACHITYSSKISRNRL
jgi:hypothetical protein